MTGRLATLATLLALTAPTHAEPPDGSPAPAGSPRAPAATATATATSTAPAPRGVALGIAVGEPTAVTVGYWRGKLGLEAAVGTGTRAGLGLAVHAGVALEVARLAPAMPLRVGLGGRYYHHGYDAMSFDEIPDSHYGVRAAVALAYAVDALELYAEAAPGIDVERTTSCTLASGAYSVCPHTQDDPFFFQLVLGARWFLAP